MNTDVPITLSAVFRRPRRKPQEHAGRAGSGRRQLHLQPHAIGQHLRSANPRRRAIELFHRQLGRQRKWRTECHVDRATPLPGSHSHPQPAGKLLATVGLLAQGELLQHVFGRDGVGIDGDGFCNGGVSPVMLARPGRPSSHKVASPCGVPPSNLRHAQPSSPAKMAQKTIIPPPLLPGRQSALPKQQQRR